MARLRLYLLGPPRIELDDESDCSLASLCAAHVLQTAFSLPCISMKRLSAVTDRQPSLRLG